MVKATAELMGILPSLEVLPFFTEEGVDCGFPFQLKAYSSYGEISRNLLTRKLVAGIIPWEIFIADILALPGQRNSWKIPIFLHACPTEFVLRESVYKTFYPPLKSAPIKLPKRLTVGIESQSSLTKAQTHEWLSHWKTGHSIDVTFRMLPMKMMIHALKAEALDAILAPSPWGIQAESTGLGKRDPRFSPGKYAQRLVMVCHREYLERHPGLSQTMAQAISTARARLKDNVTFTESSERMSTCGSPQVRMALMQQAAELHSFSSLNQDIIPDVNKLISELISLDDFLALPSQVAASEQTARLLLPT